MIQVMKNLNLLQKVVRHRQSNSKKVNTSKVMLLNLKQKALNQVFVIILMHAF